MFKHIRNQLNTHVVIDNLPKAAPWYQQWIPIVIAIGSMIISVESLNYTRETVVIGSRPYVWANNTTFPNKLAIIVKGHPAIVTKLTIDFSLNNKILRTYSDPINTHFPDDNWWYTVYNEDFKIITNRPEENKIYRIVTINYSDLDKSNNYETTMKQIFVPEDNQWRTMSSYAN